MLYVLVRSISSACPQYMFSWRNKKNIYLGPVVQSVVSLTSLFVMKILTVLVSTISNSQVFLLKKMWVAFAKATHIFCSKNISIYVIYNDQSFNNMLINNIVSFEQLGPGYSSNLLLWIPCCRWSIFILWGSKQLKVAILNSLLFSKGLFYMCDLNTISAWKKHLASYKASE